MDDKSSCREMVWLLRLRQGSLFEAEHVSIEFLGAYEAQVPWSPIREQIIETVEVAGLMDTLAQTARESTTPVT